MIQNFDFKAGWLRAALLSLGLSLFVACGTPANIVYFQDTPPETTLVPQVVQPIRLKPADQVSIIVNCRDAQVAAMFNLPYFAKRLGEVSSTDGGGVSNSTQGISGYTVDSKGEIDFPIIGKIHVAGLTREEAQEYIKELLVESRQVKDPKVTIDFMNLGYSVLGEVSRPGRYAIDKDLYTLFDAISRAGDLTINGERETVTLVRHSMDGDVVYKLNLLNTAELYESPAFYLQQGDVIYVTPNAKRLRESTVNANNLYSASFWMSVSSLAMTITTFLLNLTK